MCGIAGFICSEHRLYTEDLLAMLKCLVHRGPDDEGVWQDPSTGVALGHRRLSVVDLSPLGRQPMVSHTGRFVLTFNGEIYNYREMKRELLERGVVFRGGSDTEVLLAGVEEWGLIETLRRCVGMFALALWDSRERRLHLSRDRMGEKPLYYGWQGKNFLFGSEVSALRAHPSWKASIDRQALSLMLRHGYIPAPLSIFEGIFKLEPGTCLSIPLADMESRPAHFSPYADWAASSLCPKAYWSLREVVARGFEQPFRGDRQEALRELRRRLEVAIQDQMVADVPVGAFLSGGIDSSTVVALMQSLASLPVKTFSIGFEEADYNEAPFAAQVARHLGTEHHELYVSAQAAQQVVPKLAHMYSEPFGDSSQIPTYLVSRLAREKVTVSLSGDGGDELFGGYSRYYWAIKYWGFVRMAPLPLRRLLKRLIQSTGPRSLDTLAALVAPLFPKRFRIARFGMRAQRASELLYVDSREDFYREVVSHVSNAERMVKGSNYARERGAFDVHDKLDLPFLERMLLIDMQTYLPDDILTKVDRAAMAVSLETRIPLLDHRVIEFVWSLPSSLRSDGARTKVLLRDLAYSVVPRSLLERTKMGFSIPLGQWLTGALRPWAEDLLQDSLLDREGYFESSMVRNLWREHVEGRRDWQYALWNILMFQSWHSSVR